MRRMPGACQHDREMELLFGQASPVPIPASPSEYRADLEQPDIALSHAPVVLDAPDQARQQLRPQVRLLARQRVLDRDRVGTVGGAEWQGAGLEQAGAVAGQPVPNVSEGELGLSVGHRARTIGTQL